MAQAADIGPYLRQRRSKPGRDFLLGSAGGVGFLNSDVNAEASRTDGVGCAQGSGQHRPRAQFSGRSVKITVRASVTLAALGAFSQCKALTTINLRRAGWWAVSSMQIGPMSAVMQNRRKIFHHFACDNPGNCENQPIGSFAPSNGTIDTKVSTDWNISVGGTSRLVGKSGNAAVSARCLYARDLRRCSGPSQHSRS